MQPFDRYLLVKRRHNRRTAHRRAADRRRKRGLIGFGALVGLLAAAVLLGTAWVYAGLTADLPDVVLIETLLDPENGPLLQPTRLYDRSGEHLLASLDNPGIERRYLPLDPDAPEHIEPLLVHAFVALHDPTFWTDPGIRWDRLTDPRPATLPERLVHDLLLWDEPDGWQKTARMRLLAAQLIKTYKHSQVLEWYLNSVSFGRRAYGVDSAARLYLGKPATSLSLAEAALLAAIAETPALNPLDAPAAMRELQPAALRRMYDAGQISEADYRRAAAEELAFAEPPPLADSPAAAFTNLVIAQLAERFDRRWIERGGLQIVTSLDLDLQRELACTLQAQLSGGPSAAPADCAAARLLPSINRRPDGELVGSAVLLDVATGEVLALAGDTTAAGEQPVLSARPPGSLLTPFLAVSGFARGLGPASLVWDVPPARAAGEEPSQSVGERYQGPIRLRSALANDTLGPLKQLVEQIGPEQVWRTADSLGLSGLSAPDGEILSSGGAVSPLNAAHAYSVFAQLGLRTGQRDPLSGQIEPVLVRSVRGFDGRVWLEHETPETQAVLSQPLAYLVHHVLSDEPARWPSLGYPNALEIDRPAGAKVARTADGRSTWAAGYTRRHAAVVWIGASGTSTEEVDTALAAGIWHALMQHAERDWPIENWRTPPGITSVAVCDPSGLLPTAACQNVVTEVFSSGNEPVAYDNLYRTFQINRETGRLATVFTPVELIEERTYMVVPPEAQEWARIMNLPVPPQEYDLIQPPPPSPNVQISTPTLYSFVSGKVALQGSATGEGFRSYQLQVGEGINPQTWIQIGEESTRPVTSGLLGEWDTTGLDGLYAVRLLVVRDDQTVETHITQVTVDNQPPLVRVTAPLDGEELEPRSRSVTLQASAEDNLGIDRVTWWVDGQLVGTSTQAPYSLLWTAQPGEHMLRVEAVDLAGNAAVSAEVEFLVAPYGRGD